MADFPGQTLVEGADLATTSGSPGSPGAQSLVVLEGGGDTTPPVIVVSPAPGTPLARNDAVVIDVTDETGLLRGEVFVTLGGETYVVHDGEAFRGEFANLSSRIAIAGGYRYTVRRNGGWTKSPTFEVHAVDTSGGEAS